MRNAASNAESVYISIDFAEKYKNGLSGKYTLHSMKKKDTSGSFLTYIREPVPVPGFATNMKFFLCRKKGYWSIDFKSKAVKSGRQSEIFKKTTTGTLSVIDKSLCNFQIHVYMMNLETNPFQLDYMWDALDINGSKIGSAAIQVVSNKEEFKGTVVSGISILSLEIYFNYAI